MIEKLNWIFLSDLIKEGRIEEFKKIMETHPECLNMQIFERGWFDPTIEKEHPDLIDFLFEKRSDSVLRMVS